MRGSEGRICCAEARQHFLMSVVRLSIILGNRGRKLASRSLTAQKQGDFIYTPPRQCFNGRSLAGLTLFVSRKGWSVCLMSHAHPRPRPKPGVRG
ncbi:hypothetical protein TNIN_51891 [Trichonephila inaurata madagascariensis]|uniref:Uncharacterized protein n=1 Tax=Trichonephila inaurata madagascariensis TaxID=2747483 RepID=A0A8X7C2T8_9ARAC|nr:hypothetical protein TNIN_51891 [Trichonephila inaurata madagascariensis]